MGRKFHGDKILCLSSTPLNSNVCDYLYSCVAARCTLFSKLKPHVTLRMRTLLWQQASYGMAEFQISSMVRGYHAYKDMWQASSGDILQCGREVSN